MSMNVLVITPGVLPVPAEKGGAVEKLIEEYINYNEENNIVNFTIYTVKYNDSINNKYNYTKFRFINDSKFIYKVEKAFRWFINNKLPKIHIGNVFIRKVVKDLKKRKEKYDLIIVENIPYNVLFIRQIFPNTKIIYHIHNDFLNIHTKKGEKILEKCDKIIAVSKYIKKRIETIAKTNKVEVINNGIDLDRFKKRSTKEEINRTRKKYNFNSQDVVFLYIGRFVKEKGVMELVQAFIKLIESNKELKNKLKLLIVGSKSGKFLKKDKYRLKVEQISSKYSNNIIFTGFIAYDKLPKIYQMADVQVVPSNWGEPFGNVVIEGMASGINQIVTNDGGIPEIIEDINNKCIKVVDTKNIVDNLFKAMEEFLNNKKDIHIKNNIQNLKQFSKETYCKNILKTIENVAEMGKKYEDK